jgi:hypothetical protein
MARGILSMAAVLAVLATTDGAAEAALINVDDSVMTDQAFSDGLFVHDTFTEPGSAVGFAASSYGGTDWGLTADKYVAGNGGTVVQVAGANKNRYLPSSINYDATPGANNTYWFVTVMSNSAYVASANTAQLSVEAACDGGTLNWTNGYRGGGTFVPLVSQDANYHTFVAKMTWTATNTRDVVYWFDPDLSLGESSPVNTAKVFLNTTNSAYNVRIYIVGLISSDADATFDYFGLSTGSPFTVPEPATVALLSLGSMGVAVLRRRRRR